MGAEWMGNSLYSKQAVWIVINCLTLLVKSGISSPIQHDSAINKSLCPAYELRIYIEHPNPNAQVGQVYLLDNSDNNIYTAKTIVHWETATMEMDTNYDNYKEKYVKKYQGRLGLERSGVGFNLVFSPVVDRDIGMYGYQFDKVIKGNGVLMPFNITAEDIRPQTTTVGTQATTTANATSNPPLIISISVISIIALALGVIIAVFLLVAYLRHKKGGSGSQPSLSTVPLETHTESDTENSSGSQPSTRAVTTGTYAESDTANNFGSKPATRAVTPKNHAESNTPNSSVSQPSTRAVTPKTDAESNTSNTSEGEPSVSIVPHGVVDHQRPKKPPPSPPTKDSNEGTESSRQIRKVQGKEKPPISPKPITFPSGSVYEQQGPATPYTNKPTDSPTSHFPYSQSDQGTEQEKRYGQEDTDLTDVSETPKTVRERKEVLEKSITKNSPSGNMALNKNSEKTAASNFSTGDKTSDAQHHKENYKEISVKKDLFGHKNLKADDDQIRQAEALLAIPSDPIEDTTKSDPKEDDGLLQNSE